MHQAHTTIDYIYLYRSSCFWSHDHIDNIGFLWKWKKCFYVIVCIHDLTRIIHLHISLFTKIVLKRIIYVYLSEMNRWCSIGFTISVIYKIEESFVFSVQLPDFFQYTILDIYYFLWLMYMYIIVYYKNIFSGKFAFLFLQRIAKVQAVLGCRRWR